MFEGSSQVGVELAPVICVKVEVPDAEQLGCLDKISSADDSSIAHDEGLNPVGILSNGFQQTALPEYGEPQLCAGKYKNCVTNETLFDHLEDVEPISVLVPWDGASVKLATPESVYEEFLDSPLATEKRKETRDAGSCISSPPDNPESYVFSHSRSSSSIEELSEQRSSSGMQAPDMLQMQDDSVNSPGKNCGSQVDSMISLRTDESLLSVEDAKADEEQSSMYSSIAIKKNDLHCEGPDEDELLKAEEKQKPASLISDTEISACKRKLFGKQSGKKASPVRSDIQSDKVNVNHRQPGQGCSESAIAFSQRQMHDMESLAVKLIDELKSMKDIVEQKLLFEAYRSISLKNNADEVKSVINNAKKVEEMARKWMSVMARDCNRFCKIMKMTPNNTTGSNDAVPRSRKKIIFADEAGGKLCHVKFFGDDETSPVSADGKQ
ncbi:hypothetical protein Sango_2131400 [Sesamum angolense]|uniref:Uncharacterized protein n=1 Tax=Sesamum angolense TaxID=2727404 RepID=A0AAE2BMC2_9LAMI|nr:hypothetical protein Sango_2131400 [Sesamum angolense]